MYTVIQENQGKSWKKSIIKFLVNISHSDLQFITYHNCTGCLNWYKLFLFPWFRLGKKLNFIHLQNHVNLQVRSAINQPTSPSEDCLSSWLQLLKKIQMKLILPEFANSLKVKHFTSMIWYQWRSDRTQTSSKAQKTGWRSGNSRHPAL